MQPLITPDLVALDADLGDDKDAVIRGLAERLAAAGRSSDVDGLVADVMDREGKAATGLPGGIAIPHCRSEHVTTGSLGFARLDPAVDFGAGDGPADLVFLIAAAADGDADHMKLLTKLARALVRKEFTQALRDAQSVDEIVTLVSDVVAPDEPATAPAASEASADRATADRAAGDRAAGDGETTAATAGTATAVAKSGSGDDRRRSLVAITACPTGIAHTYMAADSLEQAAAEADVDIIVETQGSSGSTPLTREQIEAADAVIFAADVGIRDRGRFAGLPVIQSGVKRAINEPDVMVAEALAAADNPNAQRVEGDYDGGEEAGDEGAATKLRKWLMTGVSYMIPFVAAGGLLIALGFLIAGYDITETAADVIVQNSLFNLPDGGLAQYLGAVAFQLGSLGFSFLVPALAGYIAYAIADRPGIAPGFIMGAVANAIGGGFLGGLVGGLLAGAVALWISHFKVPEWMRGLMPVVVIPLGATLISGAIMIIVLGEPLSAITTGLEDWLSGLSGTSSLILGAVIGLMMAFDMGGPVNKAAYTFGAAGLGAAATATGGDNGPLIIMAAVMAAGMVPPLALALATVLRPSAFTPAERENGKAAWLLGASFITEGAIPFAAADPLRVIPAIMLGSAVTGAIVTTAGVTLRAPHGGIFVLFAIEGVLTFLIALVVGTVVGAAAVLFAKQLGRHEPAGA